MVSLAPLAPTLDARALLREQHHRINNEYTSAINLVAVARSGPITGTSRQRFVT